MKLCARCGETLTSLVFEGTAMDGCFRCGGIWFEMDAVRRLAQPSPEEVNRLEDLFPGAMVFIATSFGARQCPNCRIPLVPFELKHSPRIKLDGCRQCKGVWLDGRELKMLEQRLRQPPGLSAGVRPGLRERMHWGKRFLERTACPNCGQLNTASDARCYDCGSWLEPIPRRGGKAA